MNDNKLDEDFKTLYYIRKGIREKEKNRKRFVDENSSKLKTKEVKTPKKFKILTQV